MSLAAAVDELIAFVESHGENVLGQAELQARFVDLDRAVWLAARANNLAVELRELGEGRRTDLQYLGHTYFPGPPVAIDVDENYFARKERLLVELCLVETPLHRWRRRLLDLRALGDGGGIPAGDASYDDFRDGGVPGGRLMTVRWCKERYDVSGPELTRRAKKEPGIRRKNPDGPGHVYRYDVVREINERKRPGERKAREDESSDA
jgi:hypothetical protein